MVNFLPQTQLRAPGNQGNALARLGETIGNAIEQRRTKNALAEIGKFAQAGDLQGASSAAFEGGQPGLGVNFLNQVQSQKNLELTRDDRQAGRKQAQNNADRSFNDRKQARSDARLFSLEGRDQAAAESKRRFDIGQTNASAERALKKRGQDLKAANNGSGKPAERKVGNFAARMIDAEKTLRELGPQVDNALAAGSSEFAANFMRSQEGQLYRQAAMQWVRAQLRKESGAVIGEDEARDEFRTYFPVPGDKADTIEQKQRARITLIDNTRKEAGNGFSSDDALSELKKSIGGGPSFDQGDIPEPPAGFQVVK